MNLTENTCYFCLANEAKHEANFDDGVARLCPSCFKQYTDTLKLSEVPVTELEFKDVSELCKKCGLCCIMLRARVREEEVTNLLEEASSKGIKPEGMTVEKFCSYQLEPPYEGELTIDMPCAYLSGSLMTNTACRVYHLSRPRVCKSYICKVALEYKLGKVSLGHAMFMLRHAFMSGDVSIFNWSGGLEDKKYEQRLGLLYDAAKAIKSMKEKGENPEDIEFVIASMITPEYVPHPPISALIFSMYLYNFDNQTLNFTELFPKLYDKLNNKREQYIVDKAMYEVFREFRSLFAKASELKPAVLKAVKNEIKAVAPKVDKREDTE